MKIKEIVEQILKEYPRTRDDDFLLCLHVLIRMGYARKSQTSITIYYKNLEFAPAFETITRIRREIQNNEGRLSPSQETQEKRGKNEKKRA